MAKETQQKAVAQTATAQQVVASAKAPLTEEQKQAKRAKAKERRANRRVNNMEAINEIVGLLTEEQRAQLSDKAKHLVQVLTRTYKPGVQIEVHKGDSIIELLMVKYRDVKNMGKKLEKYCSENGLKLNYKNGLVE